MDAAHASVRDRVDTADNCVMVEIFQNFEYAIGGAVQSNPLVLAGLGIAAVLAGLCVWLAGLRIRIVVVGTIAAAGGFIVGVVVIDRGPVAAAAAAAVAALAAIALEKVFITVLAVALAGVFGFAVLASPYMEYSGTAESASRHEVSGAASSGDGEVMAELKAYAVDVGERARQAASKMPPQRLILVAGLAAICVVGGFTLWRLTAAMCFSTLGTTLIFFGMTLLLLYKGSSPSGCLSERPLLYAGVFAGMIVFGTVEQLVLCRRPQTGPVKKKTDDKENEDTGTKKKRWRTT